MCRATAAVTILFLIFFILPTIIFSLSTTYVASNIHPSELVRPARHRVLTHRILRRFVGSTLHALLRNNRLKDDSYARVPHKITTVDEEMV